MSVRKIGVRAELEDLVTKEVSKMRKETAKEFDKMKSSGNSLTSTFKKMATAAGGLFILKKVGDFMVDAAADASALEEATSKFNVVFDGVSEKAQEMSDTLVSAYAMSRRESMQSLSSIQDLLVPMGMASDAAADMSGEIVKMAADLGSFNDLPTASVMQDIQSALVGNFETMKKYSVTLNETVIRERALADGLITGKERIDALTKAQTAFKIITEKSAFAVGDMERTAEGWANQQKKLNARWEDFKAGIGGFIIQSPVMQAALKKTIGLLEDLTELLTDQLTPEERELVNLEKQLADERAKLGKKTGQLNEETEKQVDLGLNLHEAQTMNFKDLAKLNDERIKESTNINAAVNDMNSYIDTTGSVIVSLEKRREQLLALIEKQKEAAESDVTEDKTAITDSAEKAKREAIQATQDLEFELGMIGLEQYQEILMQRWEAFKGSEEEKELFHLETLQRIAELDNEAFEAENELIKKSNAIAKKANDELKKDALDRLAHIKGASLAIGDAIGAGFAAGEAKGKVALKGLLNLLLNYIEKSLLLMVGDVAIKTAMGNFAAIALGATAVAAVGAARAGVASFETEPGEIKTVPGPRGAPQLAIVHGEEEIGLPAAGGGRGGVTNQFFLPASSGTSKEEMEDILRGMVRDGYMDSFKVELEAA
ncbi:MAG: hypothetical protein U9Q21_02580 [Candidatus Auribacterota bacterium]|nr:hypothetical protein [Candidatus Auribacterota bacterium]